MLVLVHKALPEMTRAISRYKMVQPATLMPMPRGTSRVGFTDSSGAVAIICATYARTRHATVSATCVNDCARHVPAQMVLHWLHICRPAQCQTRALHWCMTAPVPVSVGLDWFACCQCTRKPSNVRMTRDVACKVAVPQSPSKQRTPWKRP